MVLRVSPCVSVSSWLATPSYIFCFVILHASYRIARALDLPVWLLGKGSNTVFPDEGFPGLVVLNRIATHKTLVQNADGALLEVGRCAPPHGRQLHTHSHCIVRTLTFWFTVSVILTLACIDLNAVVIPWCSSASD